MFNNQLFDSWLNKKSDEILSKVDRETISTEEMIILVLKAQTNHFYHTDIDLKKGMSDIDHRMEKGFLHFDSKLEKSISDLENKMEKGLADLDNKMEKGLAALDKKIENSDIRITSLERRIDSLDQKIDNRFMWTIGITVAMSAGIYLKLFLG
ncbi:MAG: hypothetical protein ACXVLQ_04025 [Bacteriovorax sp.]